MEKSNVNLIRTILESHMDEPVIISEKKIFIFQLWVWERKF